MCGRYAVYSNKQKITKHFNINPNDNIEMSYNIAPTENVTVICQIDSERIAVTMRWGLIPSWQLSISKSAPLINARIETVDSKPSFRDSFKKRRCLIIADGFFEWKPVDEGKSIPHFIQRKDQQPFALAGIWDKWVDVDKAIDSCAIITTLAPVSLQTLHDRSPGIILPDMYDKWLDQSTDVKQLKDLINPMPEPDILCYPVSSAVNRAKYKGADCIIPI